MKLIFAFIPLVSLVCPVSAKPLQVYILAGQSNMQGHAKITTMEHIGMDPVTKPMLDEMLGKDGKPKICKRVWISSIGCAGDDMKEQTGKLTTGFGATTEKIGPEFTFGLYMEKSTDAPILLIKTSWGGKSLNTDFRSPGAGPYEFNETQLAAFQKQGKDLAVIKAEKHQATGVYYRLMIDHVKKVLGDIRRVVPDYQSSDGYELAGFAWFQGWNDLVDSSTYPNRGKPGGYDAYSSVMAHFIRDVRKDLDTPKLPFVIAVLGVGGPTAKFGPAEQRNAAMHESFRNAMAAPARMPEFQGTVASIRTEDYWDPELTATKAKDAAIQQKSKKLAAEGKLKPAEEKAGLEKMRSKELSERERILLAKGISNQEFHYLGSAKILGGIGKGLAEAMVKLTQN